jgi:hypothetical protein
VSQESAHILSHIAAFAFCCWMLGHSKYPTSRLKIFRWIRQEVGPFALALVIIRYLTQVYAQADSGALINRNAVIGLALGAVFWLELRKDPDDDERWKRRRRQLGRLVRTATGRLIIAPDGAR